MRGEGEVRGMDQFLQHTLNALILGGTLLAAAGALAMFGYALAGGEDTTIVILLFRVRLCFLLLCGELLLYPIRGGCLLFACELFSS